MYDDVAARQYQVRREKVFAFRAHHKTYGQVAEINFMYDDVAARQYQTDYESVFTLWAQSEVRGIISSDQLHTQRSRCPDDECQDLQRRQYQLGHETVFAFRAHARIRDPKAEFNFIKEQFTAWLNQKELSILLRASMK
ncbi:MAG: hypothetical protein AAFY76_01480 [Cyanobacteria bacterium J06649_11]